MITYQKPDYRKDCIFSLFNFHFINDRGGGNDEGWGQGGLACRTAAERKALLL